ncbi:UDP-glucuronate:xylan alpha-glucuronosyltransferase 2-like isoform X1 [Zingiber officinale]|uniref:UDP-glucuronate:xylan alpha-glucuronosyltransferase 2-like isoform X1 n=2 Tax=Zingiber officinale TaxID=94328 RepID=UPI001C4D9DBF|nr:UDP-glucuronate:xylan alpha-glucuronosyltransferase 2-like isoform X1 [Zingiber officinale]
MGSSFMVKTVATKPLVIKINLAFISFFLSAYLLLLLLHSPSTPSLREQRSNADEIILCSLRNCHLKKVRVKKQGRGNAMERIPSFLNSLPANTEVALVNIGVAEASDRGLLVGRRIPVAFERVSSNLRWEDLFPEWIDEDEENGEPSCPEIPMPDFSSYGVVDLVAAKLPCEGRRRDVFRLQVHLVAAGMAARRGRRGARGAVRLALLSACRPMTELFRCDDVVAREGEWWVFEVEAWRLEQKVALPVGSCDLASPLRVKGSGRVFDISKLVGAPKVADGREAYATVIHSSDQYVCGAIALARSVIRTGTARDLVLLHDKFIPGEKLVALTAAGWQLREIERIRNPRAQKGSYNEYNYSKLRLWQLTEYRKVVFVDADVLVLRNLDLLFRFPQVSAAGNDGVIFNSGVMVLEPSACTFAALMAARADVVSYNGGDQGFLNEAFVWWHRLPRRVNFLKNIWSNTTAEASVKNRLMGAAAGPGGELYAIHYLGIKPWMCHREYDCNWNVAEQRPYASDAAHATWWKLHDEMEVGLLALCGPTGPRKNELEKERKQAEMMGFSDGHWRLNVSDQSVRLVVNG